MSGTLIIGGDGMLGRTLSRRWADAAAHGRAQVDLTRPETIAAALDARRPTIVVNCAAMTAVDACESDRERAFAVNAHGAGDLAAACDRAGATLVHISTDYVFPGDLDRPYREDDATGPRTVYGQSKLAGEIAVRERCRSHLIARIAWLYGAGGPSFVHTMAKLAAQAGGPLNVVDDQRGNPTSTDAVADHLGLLIARGIRGTVHLSCEGETTWFDFAREILEWRGSTRGVRPCTTAQFPRPAPRPANSSLDKVALRSHHLPPMPHWRDAFAAFTRTWPDG
ncbi:MAG TPA: dTDP-4-dehydrorhamnose reductase [Planctomycetota bacterium]|nr:dTDP-4-dehydrorhamnose reductase [Planctomycetota bacterium]